MASAHGEVEIIQNWQDKGNAISNVTANFYAVLDSGYAWSNYDTYPKLTLDGLTETKTLSSYNLNSNNTKILLGSITKNVQHDNDGTKTVYASFSWDPSNHTLSAISGNASKILTKIPRYASIDSFSVSNISGNNGLTRVKFSFSASDIIDYVWYSTNNGSSWTGYNIADGTSGNFEVSGLSPATSYKFKLRVRRKDSQLTTDSSTVTKSTYDIARFSSYSNFNLGDSTTVKYNNPAGATIQVGIYDTEGKNAYASYRTVTGSSYTFSFTDAELDLIYKAMKTSNSLSAKLYINTNNNAYRESKDITIKLTGNQKTGHVNINGTWKRTKRWININGTWKRSVRWININGTWKRCI